MSEHDRETEIEVLERNLWAVITGFSHREIAASIAKACDCDLAPASWALLEYLERSGPTRVSDLASCQGVDVSSITPRLQALERDSLIQRTRSSNDRRVSLISLGENGQAALQFIRKARRKMLEEALSGVAPDNIAAAVDILRKISRSFGHHSSGESLPD